MRIAACQMVSGTDVETNLIVYEAQSHAQYYLAPTSPEAKFHVENLTKLLGFEVQSNMLFCITIFVAFYLIFELTIRVSKVYTNNISLVQEISLLKNRVEQLEKEKK